MCVCVYVYIHIFFQDFIKLLGQQRKRCFPVWLAEPPKATRPLWKQYLSVEAAGKAVSSLFFHSLLHPSLPAFL